jgi:hypothetical protein
VELLENCEVLLKQCGVNTGMIFILSLSSHWETIHTDTYLWVFIVPTITVANDVDALIFLVAITGKVWCFLWRHLSLIYHTKI